MGRKGMAGGSGTGDKRRRERLEGRCWCEYQAYIVPRGPLWD